MIDIRLNWNGLSNFNVLNEGDRMKVLELEEERNIGVIESLKRDVTLVLTHDSGFRKPAKEIVKNGIFPAVPFPEVKAKSVVSTETGFVVAGWTRSSGNGGKDLLVINIDKEGNKIPMENDAQK